MRTALLALWLASSLSQTRIVWQGPSGSKVVALTFDAGADRGYAASILATLERAHIHATFGMTGQWAEKNADLVRRIARDHDLFMNHTFDHRSFTGYSTHSGPLSASQRAWEINQTEKVVRRLTGRSTKPYFRPPFGDYDANTLKLAHQLGYRYMVMWTVDTLGWEGLSPSGIIGRALRLTHPGSILLMHVGIQSQDGTALPAVIADLRARGYRFVTIAQLLNAQSR